MLRFRVGFVIFLSLLFWGCSGVMTRSHPLPFSDSPDQKTDLKTLWNSRMSGLVTDLSVSRQGNAILVALIPDPDRENQGIKKPHLQLYQPDGDLIWEKKMESRVRKQAISEDGKRVFVSTYNEELMALDEKGNEIWKTARFCKPYALKNGNVICYFDSDSEPSLAFEVYDPSGKKIHSFKVPKEVLSFEISEDHQFFAVSLVGGWVFLLDHQYQRIWRKQIRGEIIDIAVSSAPQPKISILYNSRVKGKSRFVQKVAIIDDRAKILASKAVVVHSEQLAISEKGDGILLYGNSPRGQYFAKVIYKQEDGKTPRLAENWQVLDRHYADYSSRLVVKKDLILLGLEDLVLEKGTELQKAVRKAGSLYVIGDLERSKKGNRHSHLYAFDPNGKVVWDLSIKTEDGAYLYGFSQDGFSTAKGSEGRSILAIANDNGYVTTFQAVSR